MAPEDKAVGGGVHAGRAPGRLPVRYAGRRRVPATLPNQRPSVSAGIALAAPLIAAVGAAVIVFHGALGYFFSQDDFLGLARASGLAPRLAGPWRYLSHQAVFDFLRPLAGLDASIYHLVSLVSHAACAVLLGAFLTRRVSRPAALLGAVFFAAHPALFSAVYWFSAIGDSLALLFALTALMLALRPDRLRWIALPAFALSLMAKESTVLLPVVVAFASRSDPAASGASRRGRMGATLGLVAVAVAYGAAFLIGNAFGVRDEQAARAPYALGVGAHIGANALTYLGWTAASLYPVVRGFDDAVDPTVYPWAVGALVLWLAGLASRRLRRSGWVMSGAIWLLFLLPVLGLRNHIYHYYLYAPLAGAAWCVAAAADRVLPRGIIGWLAAGGAAALLTLNGALLVRKIETMPFVLPGSRSEPIVDRALIAANVRRGLAAARLPYGATLLLWSPTSASIGPRGEPLGRVAPQPTYWEHNVRAALLEGLAVRVMFPSIAEARFVREFQPMPGNVWYAAYLPDGHVQVATSAQVDSILRSMPRAR